MSDMTVWTIYDRPSDYPEGAIAREWSVDDDVAPTGALILAPSIDKLRELLGGCGLIRIPRSAGDDAVIVETWL